MAASDTQGSDVIAAEAKAALSTLYVAVAVQTDAPTTLSHSHMVDVAAAGSRPDGFLTETGAINKGVHYRTAQTAQPQTAVAVGAITRGALLVVGADGKLDVSTNGTTGNAIVGKALAPASGNNSRFSFLPGNYGTV